MWLCAKAPVLAGLQMFYSGHRKGAFAASLEAHAPELELKLEMELKQSIHALHGDALALYTWNLEQKPAYNAKPSVALRSL